jgi:hypothetical protein
MMMVELAHSSTSVFFVLFEKCVLSIFECFFKEKLLIFIRTFGFCLQFFYNIFEDDFFISIKLLQLNISQLTIVKVLAEDNIKVMGFGMIVSDRFHLIRQIFDTHGSLVVFEHRKVFVALHPGRLFSIL